VVGRAQKLTAKRSAKVAIFALLAISLEACFSSPQPPYPLIPHSSAPGVRSHIVQSGETIYHIARLYGVTPARLMAANGLRDPRQLASGQTLIIPLSSGTSTSASYSIWPAPAERQFAWPVTAGQVSSPFGIRNGVKHDGVDIVAYAGAPVRAADDGTVIFSGRLHGYGNAVILQHSGGYVTVYGHNQRNLVAYGARVVRGQVIAELGSTGRATGPNLHFEVRYQGQPQNPLAYLSQPPPGPGISFARLGGS
jgi:murein DD-endopeptidase MepM/ murein hydrolase activator NlpD